MHVFPMINVYLGMTSAKMNFRWVLFTLQIIFGTRRKSLRPCNNSLKCSVSGVRHLLLERRPSVKRPLGKGLWGGTEDQAHRGQYIFLEGYANI